MNKKHLLYGIAFMATTAMVLTTTRVESKQGNPPAGSVGDPFANATCVNGGCHGGALQTVTSQNLTLTIGTSTPTTPLNSSFEYAAGTQYNIGFLINAFTGRYGFQIVALDASNQQAGTMTVSNAATTKINTLSGRQYMGHLNASSTKNWVFKWTAPAASTGPVTFYYTFATEDGDGDPGSDVIYKSSVTINPAATGINDLSSKVGHLKVFPNPITSDFGLTFSAAESMDLTAELYNLNGELVKNLMNENVSEGAFTRNFNISDLAAGVYMVKLTSGSASVTQKIFKQ